MKLYIANCTKQNIEFPYRIPEEVSLRIQRIGIGRQIQIAGDLSTADIDAILKQHKKYGLIPVAEVKNMRMFTGMCYSVDRPISIDNIMLVIDRNTRILVERGKEFRKQAAVSANNLIDHHLAEANNPSTLETLEMSIQQEEKPNQENVDMVNEGIRVTKKQIDGQPPPPKRSRNRRAA